MSRVDKVTLLVCDECGISFFQDNVSTFCLCCGTPLTRATFIRTPPEQYEPVPVPPVSAEVVVTIRAWREVEPQDEVSILNSLIDAYPDMDTFELDRAIVAAREVTE